MPRTRSTDGNRNGHDRARSTRPDTEALTQRRLRDGRWRVVGNRTPDDLPSGVAVDMATDTVYVANAGANTVSVFDGATCSAMVSSGCGQLPAEVPVGPGPLALTIDPISDTVYVANSGGTSISMLDTRRCNAARLSDCPTTAPPAVDVEANPFNVDTDQRSHTAYVTTIGDHNGWAVFDTGTCNARRQSGCTMLGRLAGDPAGPNDGKVEVAPGRVRADRCNELGSAGAVASNRCTTLDPFRSSPRTGLPRPGTSAGRASAHRSRHQQLSDASPPACRWRRELRPFAVSAAIWPAGRHDRRHLQPSRELRPAAAHASHAGARSCTADTAPARRRRHAAGRRVVRPPSSDHSNCWSVPPVRWVRPCSHAFGAPSSLGAVRKINQRAVSTDGKLEDIAEERPGRVWVRRVDDGAHGCDPARQGNRHGRRLQRTP